LAPAGIDNFLHFGSDILCVWDPEDPATDIWLRAALVTARALSVRQQGDTAAQQADFESIERAVLEIEKRAGNLAEIRRSAPTIVNSGEKIIQRVDRDEKAFAKQLDLLRDHLTDVRTALGCHEGESTP